MNKINAPSTTPLPGPDSPLPSQELVRQQTGVNLAGLRSSIGFEALGPLIVPAGALGVMMWGFRKMFDGVLGNSSSAGRHLA